MGLPPGVRSGRLRVRALRLIEQLPKVDRDLVLAALRKLPAAEAGRVLSEIGKLDDASALADALAERRLPAPEVNPSGGPEQPTGALDDPSKVHLGEDEQLRQIENRPPARVSDLEAGVSRGALKGRMIRAGMAPDWAVRPGDWNPHHLLPVSLENHPVLDTLRANGGWDNNAPRNGIALPTRENIPGAGKLPVHQLTPEIYREANMPRPSAATMRDLQGHPIWNSDVEARLDALKPLMENPVELRAAVEALIDELRRKIESGDRSILY